MSDPREEGIVPPTNDEVRLLLRCPRSRCGRTMLRTWQARGVVYFMTAGQVNWCKPDAPQVPVHCHDAQHARVYWIDAAKLHDVTLTLDTPTGVPLSIVAVS